MKSNLKRTVYLILLSVILYSASMSVPQIYNSRWRAAVQGGAAGLMVAAVLSILPLILHRNKKKN